METTPKHRPSSKEQRRGFFITFEGIEGSGKSSQCQRLAANLQAKGYWVLETREPGGTPFAEHIRGLLLNTTGRNSSWESLTPEGEAFLVLACRSQHVAHVIAPALKKGAVVLCDRFFDSTLAYQGYGRGLDLKALQNLNQFATQGLTPDLTFLFDLPVDQGLARRRRALHQNRLDREKEKFHERVRKGFMALAKDHPHRITIIDAGDTIDTIAEQVAKRVQPFLSRMKKLRPSKKPG